MLPLMPAIFYKDRFLIKEINLQRFRDVRLAMASLRRIEGEIIN